MKRIVYALIVAIFSICSSKAQYYIGFRDSKYAILGYTIDNKWQLQFDHSVFSEHFKYQYIRISGGYNYTKGQIGLSANVYGGITYCNSFYDMGAKIYGYYLPLKWFGINAVINPHYDEGYDYKTCYMIGTLFRVTNEFSVLAQFNTIPEYRQSEDRVKIGLSIKVKNLHVSPMISVPTNGNTKTVRVLFGFKYEIPYKKKNI
ncbi:MAG: hypothetical protein PUF65_08415 [Lachnospiraceae bacterium]|nr:hypothetical protein [Lachnospiraceae bacterium]